MDATDDTDSLAPGFLVAAPKLEGGPFEQAVVLMVHHDDEGAMGFIINKTVDLDFGSLLQNTNHDFSEQLPPDHFEQHVLFGGPVQLEQLWLIYRDPDTGIEYSAGMGGDALTPETMGETGDLSFHEDWVLAGTSETIEAFATGGRDGPFHPLIGYAGWGPQQLEHEIEEGSWLAVDFDETLLLETDPDDCWEAALDLVGLDPASFMMMGGGGMA